MRLLELSSQSLEPHVTLHYFLAPALIVSLRLFLFSYLLQEARLFLFS